MGIFYTEMKINKENAEEEVEVVKEGVGSILLVLILFPYVLVGFVMGVVILMTKISDAISKSIMKKIILTL